MPVQTSNTRKSTENGIFFLKRKKEKFAMHCVELLIFATVFFCRVCMRCWVLWFSSKKMQHFLCMLNIHSTHKICTILDCWFSLCILRPTVRSDSILLQSFHFDLTLAMNTIYVFLCIALSMLCFVDFPTVLITIADYLCSVNKYNSVHKQSTNKCISTLYFISFHLFIICSSVTIAASSRINYENFIFSWCTKRVHQLKQFHFIFLQLLNGKLSNSL